MQHRYSKSIFFSTIIFLSGYQSTAQLSVQAQLRTRTEFRDGQGTPLSKGLKPAFFTSQRTRLTGVFNSYRLKLGLSLQDVRVWGQDGSTINRFTTQENNGIMLHEAWAQVQLTDTLQKASAFFLKVGRQELVYDDQRLLGNLDWQQQARRHDAALLMYQRKSWLVHFAAAYNQTKETNFNSVYSSVPSAGYPASTNGGAMYKSLEFFYAQKKWSKGSASFLFLSDQFSKYSIDSVKRYLPGHWSRETMGMYFTHSVENVNLVGSAYYQFGKDAAGKRLSAGLLSASAMYKNKTLQIGPGLDYTSGGSNATANHAFDPLYGTPHKFWGLMDYFYAANSFGNAGLTDVYLKSIYAHNDRLTITADIHHFASPAKAAVLSRKKILGQEIDIVESYTLTREIGIEGGYAHFFSTDLLVSPAVKNVSHARRGANWVYLMFKIKPEFLIK